MDFDYYVPRLSLLTLLDHSQCIRLPRGKSQQHSSSRHITNSVLKKAAPTNDSFL